MTDQAAPRVAKWGTPIPLTGDRLTRPPDSVDAALEELMDVATGKRPPRQPVTYTPPPAYQLLLDATDGLTREIVELHHPGGTAFHECQGCDFDREPGEWPCRTIDLIADRADVALTPDNTRAGVSR